MSTYRLVIGDHYVRGVSAATIEQARERASTEAARQRRAVLIVEGGGKVVEAFDVDGKPLRPSYTVRVAGHLIAGTFSDDEAEHVARQLRRGGLRVEICDVWGEPLARAS